VHKRSEFYWLWIAARMHRHGMRKLLWLGDWLSCFKQPCDVRTTMFFDTPTNKITNAMIRVHALRAKGGGYCIPRHQIFWQKLTTKSTNLVSGLAIRARPLFMIFCVGLIGATSSKCGYCASNNFYGNEITNDRGISLLKWGRLIIQQYQDAPLDSEISVLEKLLKIKLSCQEFYDESPAVNYDKMRNFRCPKRQKKSLIVGMPGGVLYRVPPKSLAVVHWSVKLEIFISSQVLASTPTSRLRLESEFPGECPNRQDLRSLSIYNGPDTSGLTDISPSDPDAPRRWYFGADSRRLVTLTLTSRNQVSGQLCNIQLSVPSAY